MGNFLPEVVPGARGAALSGLWIHDAIGLFVTPLALAIIYYVIPAASGRPIYSHFLSMLGFWLLFFVYPLNGTHHYVYSVIPMEAQVSAIVASTILGIDVILVVANLLLSMRGSGFIPADVGLRFVATGTVFYLLVSIQGAAPGADGDQSDGALHGLGGRALAPGHARLCDVRRRRRARPHVGAPAGRSFQSACVRMVVLAARRRRDDDGGRPDGGGSRRGAGVAVGRRRGSNRCAPRGPTG